MKHADRPRLEKDLQEKMKPQNTSAPQRQQLADAAHNMDGADADTDLLSKALVKYMLQAWFLQISRRHVERD